MLDNFSDEIGPLGSKNSMICSNLGGDRSIEGVKLVLDIWELDMWWQRVEEEKVIENIFGVKYKGERVIVMGEIKMMLWGKDYSLPLVIPCKNRWWLC